MGFDPERHEIDPEKQQDLLLGPLVRVIEEAALDTPWALIGAAAVRLQGVEAHSLNLEFMTSEQVLEAVGRMLGVTSDWGQGTHLAANRLQFTRFDVPVFIFGDPVFHGSYDAVTPRVIPSLWDARVRVEVNGATVLCTPLEWELILAVILGATERVEAIRARMVESGYDSRLVVRLLREGRVSQETEEAVWAVLERKD